MRRGLPQATFTLAVILPVLLLALPADTQTQSTRSNPRTVTERSPHSKDEPRPDSTAKGHKAKVGMALRLQAETTVSYGWITERLRMGSPSNASNLVCAKQNCKQ